MKKMILIFLLLISTLAFSISQNSTQDTGTQNGTGENSSVEMPLIPLNPSIPTTPQEDIEESGDIRILEKTFTVMLEAKVNVFVPLEVITDIDIKETVVGNQIVDIPFEIELNRKPEKENYYSLKYSENIIDIDADGKYDTYIYSPQYINDKVEKNNFVRIYGENISREGTYKKDVYITVEIGN